MKPITSEETRRTARRNKIFIDDTKLLASLGTIPDHIVENIERLIANIIDLLPPHSSIVLSKSIDRHLGIDIVNTGIDLFRYKDIVANLTVPVDIKSHPGGNGTIFRIHLKPRDFTFNNEVAHKANLAHYYATIRDVVTKHWGETSAFSIQLDHVLRNNYSDDSFDLTKWSELMTVSPSQLFRKVKQQTGVSPGRYLIEYRLKKARSQLLRTTCPIREVALSCGFKSISHFNRVFKQQFRESPSSHRDRDE